MGLLKYNVAQPPSLAAEKITQYLQGSASAADKILALKEYAKLIAYGTYSGHTIPTHADVDRVLANALPPVTSDPSVLMQAAKTIASIARLEVKELSSDYFHLQVNRALELLGDHDVAASRLSAVFILTQLATELPDEFNEVVLQSTEVGQFCHKAFAVVCDSKAEYRAAGIALLEEAINISLNRDSHTRDSLYHTIFQLVFKNLRRSSAEGPIGAMQTLYLCASAQVVIGDVRLLIETYDMALKLLQKSSTLHREALKTCPYVAASIKALRLSGKQDGVMSSVVKKRFFAGVIKQRIRSAVTEKQAVEKLWSDVLAAVETMTTQLRKDKDKAPVLTAIGNLALVLGEEMRPFLNDILTEVKSLYKKDPHKLRTESLDAANRCLSQLAVAFGEDVKDTVQAVLDRILKHTLRDSTMFLLQDIVNSVPSLTAEINRRVLVLFRGTLKEVHEKQKALITGPTSSTSSSASNTNATSGSATSTHHTEAGLLPEYVDVDEHVYVVLRHLGKFQFGPAEHHPSFWLMLAIVRDYVIPFTTAQSSQLRREASLACARLLVDPTEEQRERMRKASLAERYPLLNQSLHERKFGGDQQMIPSARQRSNFDDAAAPEKDALCRAVIFEVVSPLIKVCLSDPNPALRYELLTHLNHPTLTSDMAEDEVLVQLMRLLSDPIAEIRELTIALLGRLMHRRGLEVVVVFERFLLVMLSQLQLLCSSSENVATMTASIALADRVNQHDGASKAAQNDRTKRASSRHKDTAYTPQLYTIQHIISAAPTLVRNYLGSIYSTVTTIIESSHVSRSVRCIAYGVLGELGLVGGIEEVFDVAKCVAYFLRIMGEQFLASHRHIAMRAFANIMQGALPEVPIYRTYPALLPHLCEYLRVERNVSFRVELLRTFGIIGAEDPTREYLKTELSAARENAAPGSPEAGSMMYSLRRSLQATSLRAHVGPRSFTAAQGDPMGVAAAFRRTAGDEAALLFSALDLHEKKGTDHFFVASAVNALVKVSLDTSLSKLHIYVMRAYVVITTLLADLCKDYLVPLLRSSVRMLQSIDAPTATDLQHFVLGISKIVLMAGKNVSPFIEELVQLLDCYWSKCEAALGLMENLLLAAEVHDISQYIPLFSIRLTEAIENSRFDETGATANRIIRILTRTAHKFDGNEGSFIKIVVRILLNMKRKEDMRRALMCLLVFSLDLPLTQGASALVPVLSRFLALGDCLEEVFLLLSMIAIELGMQYLVNGFLANVHSAMKMHHRTSLVYEETVEALVSNYVFPNIKAKIREHIRRDTHTYALLKESKLQRVEPALSIRVDQEAIVDAWDISPRATAQDWQDWIKRVTRALIKSTQSTAVRACTRVCELHPPTARALFNVAYISCWTDLTSKCQDDMMRPFEQAMANMSSTPREIQELILDLAELTESVNQGKLPLSRHALANLAMENRFYAKALRYKEHELHLLLQSNIVNDWEKIKEQELRREQLKELEEGEVRLMEGAKYADVLDYFGVQLPSDEPAKNIRVTLTEEMRAENKVKKLLQFQPEKKLASCVRELIEINHHLLQPDAASGIIRSMPYIADTVMKEAAMAINFTGQQSSSWLEVLHRFNRVTSDPAEAVLNAVGRLKCHHALGEWRDLHADAKVIHAKATPDLIENLDSVVAKYECAALLGLKDYASLRKVATRMAGSEDVVESKFYEAIGLVHENKSRAAQSLIDECRDLLAVPVSLALTKSYSRSYGHLVRLQQLSMLEEVISYQRAKQHGDKAEMDSCKKVWEHRLGNVFPSSRLYQEFLSLHGLVMEPHEYQSATLQLARVARREQRLHLSHSVLCELVEGKDFLEGGFDFDQHDPVVAFACLEHKWVVGERADALERLHWLVDTRHGDASKEQVAKWVHKIGKWTEEDHLQRADNSLSGSGEGGLLTSTRTNRSTHRQVLNSISEYFYKAAVLNPNWALAWHDYAMVNLRALGDLSVGAQQRQHRPARVLVKNAVSAVLGFFRSIALSANRTFVLQDSLRLLSVWFAYGHNEEVRAAVAEGRTTVHINNWVALIPQLIARLDKNPAKIVADTQNWVVEIGKAHPHALITPLFAALKSSGMRSELASNLLAKLSVYHPDVVEDVRMVTTELIRVSALWQELWHTALTSASKQYFDEGDVSAMLDTLDKIHAETQTPCTAREISFKSTLGSRLLKARQYLDRYLRSKHEYDLNNAWSVYYEVFKVISKMLPKIRDLDLHSTAPALIARTNYNMTVFGTYDVDFAANTPKIAKFVAKVAVIPSKQRPRRIKLLDDHGNSHQYLLKGQEDPRMDERVMAFLGLVNSLLKEDFSTRSSFLSIRRYSITPIAPETGMIGWLEHCDTLFELLKNHRTSNKIPLLAEQNRMKELLPDNQGQRGSPESAAYEALPLRLRSYVFLRGCEATSGMDLAHVLMAKSPDTSSWVKRRTCFMRTLAVMSVTGYVLGLGDRHLSNIMLHRWTGEVVHIDFGDCFEAAQERESYPEYVPFRLTRVLRRAMEVGGIAGTYRQTCERTMRVLRNNKDSLVAVLEAFVHDPLISWQLIKERTGDDLHQEQQQEGDYVEKRNNQLVDDLSKHIHNKVPRKGKGLASFRSSSSSLSGEMYQQQLNQKGLDILRRVELKLDGRDFSAALTPSAEQHEALIERSKHAKYTELQICRSGICVDVDPEFPIACDPCPVNEQVEFLIQQAIDPANLCRSYFGWFPFW